MSSPPSRLICLPHTKSKPSNPNLATMVKKFMEKKPLSSSSKAVKMVIPSDVITEKWNHHFFDEEDLPIIGKIRRLRQRRRRQIIKKNEITLLHLGQTSWSLSHLHYVSTLQWYHSRRHRFRPYLAPNLRSRLQPSSRSLSISLSYSFCFLA